LTLEDGIDRFPEMSVKDYHSALRQIPKQRKSHLRRGGSLKLHKWLVFNHLRNFLTHSY
jgi:hypothetical protein